jgi:hypothetical protein
VLYTRTLPGLGCTVSLSREHSQCPVAYVGRRLVGGQKRELDDEICRAIADKNAQLGRARAENGNPTILVLETEDFTTINEHMMGEAFAAACAVDHSNIDDVYLFHQHDTNLLVFPLKCMGALFPDHARFKAFRRAQAVFLWHYSDLGRCSKTSSSLQAAK